MMNESTESPADTTEDADVRGPASGTVAIIGRPNVGKSALFNRLLGRRMAIVDDQAGVTRDRLYGRVEWQGRVFSLVDTGGLDLERANTDDIWASTRDQAKIAAETADVLLFVVDGRDGYNPLDEDVAAIVRRFKRPVIFVANKLESERARDSAIAEFSKLGFGPPHIVSAIHGEGTGDLLDVIVETLPDRPPAPSAETAFSLAIVGRPNVGKSSLVNSLLGEERSIVSNVPGTTRDAVDTIFHFHEHHIRLIDTAGVWRKTHHHGNLEYYASLRSHQAVQRADVVVLVIDSMEGIRAQDRRLAGEALEAGAGLVIVANKWDLARELGEFQQSELIEVIHEELPFAKFVPVTFLSAMTKRRLGSLMPLVMKVHACRQKRIPTARVNSIVRDAVLSHPPPASKGKAARIYYASQVASSPPRFVFSCNDPELLGFAYRRYLENVIRDAEDFTGVPLDLEFRDRRPAEAAEAGEA